MKTPLPQIIAIMGTTASGKTALSLDIAEKYNGEIICLDSRTMYRGMDIGTAKPSNAEQTRAPHHLIDIADPDKSISLGEVKIMTEKIISEIISRNHLPILVGGTAFYMYAILENWLIPEIEPDVNLRAELETLSTNQLIERLNQLDPTAINLIDIQNRRRIIRAIEIVSKTEKPLSNNRAKGLRKFDALKIALNRNESFLRSSIAQRTEKMIADGLIEEVKTLLTKYTPSLPSMNAIHYKEVVDFLNGVYKLEEMVNLINTHDWQLTRRQLTWLKRDNEISWIDDPNQADILIKKYLSQ